MPILRRSLPLASARQRLVVVAVVAGVAAVLKLVVAFRTHGTDDVRLFQGFAAGVDKFGWIGAYGEYMGPAPYNHPPLTGMLLVAINAIRDVAPWLPFEFLIRVPAILSDPAVALITFGLVRTYRSLDQATLAALVVAASPVLFIISGFHGNTDPVFVMFTMLSLYLLTARPMPVLAGVAFAMGLSIKIVPVVVLPLLLLIALRAGWRSLFMFGGGAGAFLALTWGPVLVTRWAEFKQGVLGYTGFGSQWGVVQIGRWLGVSEQVLTEQVSGPGRFVVLAVSAGLPLLLAWRRPAAAVPAFGLAYVLFLMLTPAHAMQYMSWAAAPVLLLGVLVGGAYHASAGVLLIKVYDHWNRARPWNWDTAYSAQLSTSERLLALIPWLALLAAALSSMLYLRSVASTGTPGPGPGRAAPELVLTDRTG